jgi:hypothetical protein
MDLDRLLSSNDTPLDSELPVIRAIVSEGEDRVDALDEQIRALNATLAQLARMRNDTEAHVHQHRAIMSSVRRVPAELICEIFALTLSNAESDDTTGIKPPWYFGHICRSWRRSALAYPPLWNSITIPSSITGSFLPILETQLLRSANAPLDIYWPDIQSDVDPRLLDLVLPHSPRWRTLCIYVDHPSSTRVLQWLHPINGRLDRLEKLEVINGGSTVIPDIFSIAPSLRKVIVTDCELGTFSASIAIPWGQITHYRGTYSQERQLQILKAAPNLLECAISLQLFYEFDPHTQPVILPHTRRLYVEQSGFLNHLTAPLLKELAVLYAPVRVLLTFVHRSFCTLTKLAVMRCPITPDIIPILRSLPTLTYLLLENRDDDLMENPDYEIAEEVTIFDAMSISCAPTDLCPNLTTFVYGYHDSTELPQDSFFAMIGTRFRGNPDHPTRLSCLRIFGPEYLCQAPPEDMVARMTMLWDEGLDAAFLDSHDTDLLKQSLI